MIAMPAHTSPLVSVVMGSDSDWSVMEDASRLLTEFGIAHEVEVVSAHRTPEKMIAFGKEAAGRGVRVWRRGDGRARRCGRRFRLHGWLRARAPDDQDGGQQHQPDVGPHALHAVTIGPACVPVMTLV